MHVFRKIFHFNTDFRKGNFGTRPDHWLDRIQTEEHFIVKKQLKGNGRETGNEKKIIIEM